MRVGQIATTSFSPSMIGRPSSFAVPLVMPRFTFRRSSPNPPTGRRAEPSERCPTSCVPAPRARGGRYAYPRHGFHLSWDRYEAAVNLAWSPLEIYALCLYDARRTAAWVLEAVATTHPIYALPHGSWSANPRFQPIRNYRASLAPRDKVEGRMPTHELVNPSPREARNALDALRPSDREAMPDGLSLALSEAVTNALLYGQRPVSVRFWVQPSRVVVVVHDRGAGPPDHTVGLVPPDRDAIGGRGLWLIHQLLDDVALRWEPDGFSVRLIVRW